MRVPPARGEATRPGPRASRTSSSARPASARHRAKTSMASANGGLTSTRRRNFDLAAPSWHAGQRRYPAPAGRPGGGARTRTAAYRAQARHVGNPNAIGVRAPEIQPTPPPFFPPASGLQSTISTLRGSGLHRQWGPMPGAQNCRAQRRASSNRGSSRTAAKSSSLRASSRNRGSSSTDRRRCANVSSPVAPASVAKHA